MTFKKGHTTNIGRKHSAETKEKIGAYHKGKTISDKHRKILSESRKEKPSWNKGQKVDREKYPKMGHFQKHSDYSKEKMSSSHKGQITGEKNPRWKGGKYLSKGYVLQLCPQHTNKNSQGYVYEHRLIIEKHLGRFLDPKEVVHHINEIKHDNRLENLMLFKSTGYHVAFHRYGYCDISTIIFDGRKIKEK